MLLHDGTCIPLFEKLHAQQHILVYYNYNRSVPSQITLHPQIVCLQCPTGWLSASGATTCTACSAGKYLTSPSGRPEDAFCADVSSGLPGPCEWKKVVLCQDCHVAMLCQDCCDAWT
jgi:hypothetical protein